MVAVKDEDLLKIAGAIFGAVILAVIIGGLVVRAITNKR
jgi:hypothetical protein